MAKEKEGAREQLQEMIGLVYDLNEQTDKEWFFDFCGHISCFSLRYIEMIKAKCEYCGEDTVKTTYLTHVSHWKELTKYMKILREYLPKE